MGAVHSWMYTERRDGEEGKAPPKGFSKVLPSELSNEKEVSEMNGKFERSSFHTAPHEW